MKVYIFTSLPTQGQLVGAGQRKHGQNVAEKASAATVVVVCNSSRSNQLPLDLCG